VFIRLGNNWTKRLRTIAGDLYLINAGSAIWSLWAGRAGPLTFGQIRSAAADWIASSLRSSQ
jgi:hypothetical protein